MVGICRAHGSLSWCPLPGPAFSASHLLFLECLCTLYPTDGAKCRYLLKLLTGDVLPAVESGFAAQLRLYFPRVWDMKYIMSKKNIHGGLSKARCGSLVPAVKCRMAVSMFVACMMRVNNPGAALDVLTDMLIFLVSAHSKPHSPVPLASALISRRWLQVASQLGVERIGPQHQAGSDSLLTSATFMKLLTTHLNGMTEAATFLGVLHQCALRKATSACVSAHSV